MKGDFLAPYPDEEPEYEARPIPPLFDEALYSVPRRFDLVAMLVVMTGYALMFAIFRFFGAPNVIFIYFASLTTLIGAAQMLTESRYSPRAVSVVVGILFYWFFSIFSGQFWLARV